MLLASAGAFLVLLRATWESRLRDLRRAGAFITRLRCRAAGMVDSVGGIDPDLTLTGDLVRLEPLRTDHRDALAAAAADGELWNLFYTSVPRPEAMADDIAGKLAQREAGTMYPFVAVRRADEQVLGVTTYCHVVPEVPQVEIGYTWNRRSAHGSGTNADSKLLLVGHAFDVLGCASVVFRTNFLNLQSREAIARLGARQEGILRNHMRDREGNLRDTVQFSILPHEWPAIRTGLERRVARHRTA